jgi:membrane protease YdiL (CAAX protease family)
LKKEAHPSKKGVTENRAGNQEFPALFKENDMNSAQKWIREHQLIVFLSFAFGFTWISQIALTTLVAEKADQVAFYRPTIYGPTIAALITPILTGGWKRLWIFLRKRFSFKADLVWYLGGIFFIPALLLAIRGLHRLLFPSLQIEPVQLPGIGVILSGFLMMLPLGPLGEELGWRGFALPLLQEKMSVPIASLVLGVIWWAWHLPQLLLPELQWAVGAMPILIYLVMILPGSMLAAWIFNRSKGSVIPVILFHASLNYFLGLLGFNSPYFMIMILIGLWIPALLVTFLPGSTNSAIEKGI